MATTFQVVHHRVVTFGGDDSTRALLCLTMTGPTGEYQVAYRLGADSTLRNSLTLGIGASRLGLLEIPVSKDTPEGIQDIVVLIEDTAQFEFAVAL